MTKVSHAHKFPIRKNSISYEAHTANKNSTKITVLCFADASQGINPLCHLLLKLKGHLVRKKFLLSWESSTGNVNLPCFVCI